MSEKLDVFLPDGKVSRRVKAHGPYMDRMASKWPQGTKVTWFRETGTHQYTLRAGPRWDLDRVTYTGKTRSERT